MRYFQIIFIILLSIDSFAEKQLPQFECQITFSHGLFFGYIPPRKGDKLILDLNKLAEYQNIIQFEQIDKKSSAPPYIPLTSPLELIEISAYSNGQIQSILLKNKLPHQVRLDLDSVPGAGKGANYFNLWIIEERKTIRSVAHADCQKVNLAEQTKPVIDSQ